MLLLSEHPSLLFVLQQNGIEAKENSKYGLDHGAWIPLHLIFPEGDIPIVQLSLVDSLDPREHLKIGHALSPLLKDEDILIIGSGGVTHNLYNWRGHKGGPQVLPFHQRDIFQQILIVLFCIQPWATEFDQWVEGTLTGHKGKEREDLLAGFPNHPHARDAHPRVEHFLPLLVIAGLQE